MIHFFRLLRWIFVPLAILLIIIWLISHLFCCKEEVNSTQPIQIASSHCRDDFRKIFLQEIKKAKHSIDLIIYSITDKHLVKALQERAEEGIAVTISYDPSTSSEGVMQLKDPVVKNASQVTGLMHQKILIIDRQKLWISSCNWSTDSLRVDENMALGLYSPELAESILSYSLHPHFTLGGQLLEFHTSDEKESLQILLEKIQEAKSSLKVAMFALTHPRLIDALIEAKQRGVDVVVAIDRKMSTHVNARAKKLLIDAGVELRIFSGMGSFHHKFAWVDETLLIHGSTNWTRSAFTRNKECMLFLYDLQEKQKKKLERSWHMIRSQSYLGFNHFSLYKKENEDRAPWIWQNGKTGGKKGSGTGPCVFFSSRGCDRLFCS